MKALVLAGGFDQIALLQELKRRGYYTIIADYYHDAPAGRYADKHCVVSTLDVEAIDNIAVSERVNLVTTACTDQALVTAALVSEKHNLPFYLSSHTAMMVTNKSKMKSIMKQKDIPTSDYVLLDSDTPQIDLEYPIVVKPVDCNSSKGVRKIFNRQEFYSAVREARALSRTKMVIAERYVEGIELSVDAWVDNYSATLLSITRTEKALYNDSFTITKSVYPSSISDEVIADISKTASMISLQFGIRQGPLLIQLVADGTRISVIEFSARMGGGTKYRLIETISGVDIMRQYVDLLHGTNSSITVHPTVFNIILRYIYCSPGVIEKIQGTDKLISDGIVSEFYHYKSLNSEIKQAKTSSDRVLGCLLVGTSRDETLVKERKLFERLSIISADGQNTLLDI